MRRVAWRSVRAHAKQFFLTTFAVMLGVAFLSGTLALRELSEAEPVPVAGAQGAASAAKGA